MRPKIVTWGAGRQAMVVADIVQGLPSYTIFPIARRPMGDPARVMRGVTPDDH